MVHRASRMIEIIKLLEKYHFEIKKVRFVYPKVNSNYALAVLVEAKKKGKSGEIKIEQPLYIENEDGTYTNEILKIFNYKKDE